MKNAIYTVTSNAVALFVSMIITFIAPKMISVETYSWFQVYLFYTTYVAILSLGWGEGVYLRYGGEYYENLDRNVFKSQFLAYSIIESIISICIVLFGSFFCGNQRIIFSMIGIVVLVYAPCLFFRNLLLSVNRIKEYAKTHIIEKVIYGFLCLVSLLCIPQVASPQGFLFLIIADIIGKSVADIYIFYVCGNIFTGRLLVLSDVFEEAKDNIAVGLKLLVSNLLGLFIIGIVRYAIQQNWNVETFGKISLTISISNLLMVFIRAVAAVMFPLLRRTGETKRIELYYQIRVCLIVLLSGLLMFYYPIKVILSWWLPEYANSLKYMAVLFPMCLFESKMSMLIETYMKTARMEKTLLTINVITVLLSGLSSMITVIIMQNLDAAVVSIVFLLAFRSIVSEIVLSKTINVDVLSDIALEIALVSCFIFCNWSIGGIFGQLIYCFVYCLYVLIKRREIGTLANMLLRNVHCNIIK